MGKIPQGILGGVSGSIGGLVGTSWKGINVIKTKPLSVSNPKTAAQQEQRARFSASVEFSKAILATIIKPLWDRSASRMSGYNAFMSENVAKFDQGDYPDSNDGFVMSKGKMTATPITSCTADTNGEIALSFDSSAMSGYMLSTDKAFVLLWLSSSDPIIVNANEFTRADGDIEFATGRTQGQLSGYRCQLCFQRADGTIVSNPAETSVVNA